MRLFGREEFLKDLLDSLLIIPGEETNPIVGITYEPNEKISLATANKPKILYQPKCGLRCSLQRRGKIDCPDDRVIIEIQPKYDKYFCGKMQCNAHRTLEEAVSKRTWDEMKMPRFFMLIIATHTSFNFDDKHKRFYAKCILPINTELHVQLEPEYMPLLFYDLKKFSEKNVDFFTAANQAEKWLHFLDKCSSYYEIPWNAPEIIKRAFKLTRKGTQEAKAAERELETIEMEQTEARNEERLKCKEMCFDQLVEMIKSNNSIDTVRVRYPFYGVHEIEIIIKYMKTHPEYSMDDLIAALRIFNGYGPAHI